MRWREKKQGFLKTLPFEKTNVFEREEFNSVVAWRKRLFSLSYQSALTDITVVLVFIRVRWSRTYWPIVWFTANRRRSRSHEKRQEKFGDGMQHKLFTWLWLSFDCLATLCVSYFSGWQSPKPVDKLFVFPQMNRSHEKSQNKLTMTRKHKKVVHVNFDWLNTD